MSRVQMNLRVPKDIKEWLYSEAAKDDRDPGYYLTNLIKTKLMKSAPAKKKAVAPAIPDSPQVGQLPLNDGSMHPIYQSDVDKWSSLYSAIDIGQELNKIFGWLDSNPSKRKTKTGIAKFINNWLSRAQDKGGSPYAANQSRTNPKAAVTDQLSNPQTALDNF